MQISSRFQALAISFVILVGLVASSNAILFFEDYQTCMVRFNSNYPATSICGIAYQNYQPHPSLDDTTNLIIKVLSRKLEHEDYTKSNAHTKLGYTPQVGYFLSRGTVGSSEGTNLIHMINNLGGAKGKGCNGIGAPKKQNTNDIKKEIIADFKHVLSDHETKDNLIDIAREMKRNGNKSAHVLKVAGERKSNESSCGCTIL